MTPSQDTVLGCIIKVSPSGGLEWGLAHELLNSLQGTAQPGLGTASLESRPGQDYEERNEKMERKCYISTRQAWGTSSFHLGEEWKGVQEDFVEEVASVAGELEYELTGQKPFQIDKMGGAKPWW